MRDGPEDAARPWTPAQRGWAYGLVLLLTVLLAFWGAFLVPFRVGATLVPVSLGNAAVGNVGVGRAASRLAGSAGAVGTGFLLAGAVASAVAYGAAVLRPRTDGHRR